jgi:hypothetical protein
MPDDRYRRFTGLLLGGILGLAYGVVSQWINRIALPGTPLHQPPLGPLGNTALMAAVGAALGLMTAWPNGAAGGIILASSAAAVATVGSSLLAAPRRPEMITAMVLTSAFLVLPFVGMLAPIIGLLRWATGRQVEARRERTPWPRRLILPAILAVTLALLGALSLYPPEARQIIADMDRLVAAGLRAGSPAALPPTLRTEDAPDFTGRAIPPYELAWTKADLNRFRIPRPLANFDGHSVAIAHFANGWTLACLYPWPGADPTCRGY